jgi:hypothetical protein
VTDDSQLWAGEATAPVNVERTWQLLCDTLPADEAVPGIMLSAGWDSRLLLAAAVARRRSQRLLTVSHGQPDQFELIMARRLARCAEATHHEVSLGRDALGSASELDVLFARSEALLFPYWRLSADRLRQQGAAFSTCGVLGEVLGGHYASRGSRVKRLLHLFKLRAGNESAANGVSIRALMPKPPRRPLWYLDREYLEDHRVRVGEAYEADIAETLSRYQRRGIPPGDRMVEAFITEHRAIQMVAHQPLAAFAYLDVILPFADRTLTQELTRIPVRDRIQNALSRRILSRYAPEYLRVPLAATGFAASAPIPVEVVGRAGRYAIEAVSSAAVLASGGRFGRRRPFGWMNFDQVLRPTDPIRAIVDSLRTPLINKEAVMSHLDDIDAYRAPIKLAHVFLKLVQLDRLVARSQSR